MDNPKVVAVIPAYNVANVLEKTINELPEGCFDEIVVVDDASSDATSKIAESLGTIVISHSENRGYGGAQKSGYKRALELGADAIVMIHGDNQYDPTIADQFAHRIAVDGYDLVTGTRMILGDALKGGMPMWKYIPNRFLTWLENVTFRTKITDYHNGYRAYSADFLRQVPLNLLSNRFDFDTDIIIQGAIRKCRIDEIPHETRFLNENSQMPFGKGVIYGLSILKTIGQYLLHKSGIYRRKIYCLEKLR